MYTRAQNMLYTVSKQLINRSSTPIIKNPIMKLPIFFDNIKPDNIKLNKELINIKKKKIKL